MKNLNNTNSSKNQYLEYKFLQAIKGFLLIVFVICTQSVSAQNLYEYMGKNVSYVISKLGQPINTGDETISYNNPPNIIHFSFEPSTNKVTKIDWLIDTDSKESAYHLMGELATQLAGFYNFDMKDASVEEGYINYQRGDLNISTHVIEGYDGSFYRVGVLIFKFSEEDLKQFSEFENFVISYFKAIDDGEVDKAVKFFVPEKRNKIKKLLKKIADETDYYKVLSAATFDGRAFWVDLEVKLIQKRYEKDYEENWTIIMHLERTCEDCSWQIVSVK